jgi:hypothetical protein
MEILKESVEISRRAGKALNDLILIWFEQLSIEQAVKNISEFKKATQKASSFDMLPQKVQNWILVAERRKP